MPAALTSWWSSVTDLHYALLGLLVVALLLALGVLQMGRRVAVLRRYAQKAARVSQDNAFAMALHEGISPEMVLEEVERSRGGVSLSQLRQRIPLASVPAPPPLPRR
jgi:hypothetical protein